MRNLHLFRWIDYTRTTGEETMYRNWGVTESEVRDSSSVGVINWKTRWQLEEEDWARSASCLLHRMVSDQSNWTGGQKQLSCVVCCLCSLTVTLSEVSHNWLRLKKEKCVHMLQAIWKITHLLTLSDSPPPPPAYPSSVKRMWQKGVLKFVI